MLAVLYLKIMVDLAWVCLLNLRPGKFMRLLSSPRAFGGPLRTMLLCSLLGMTSVQAQVSLNSAGGNAQGSGGSSSYSIGQTFVQSQVSGTASVLQGIQQLVVLTNLSTNELGRGSLLAYPNPTAEYLELRIANVPGWRHWVVLYDAHGKAVRKVSIDQVLTSLYLGDLPAATYTACVFDEHGLELQTVKIIKLNQ